jgi:predicted regulator of Ras-like GTPase activity (Roadblock/LC7/MglB family)
VGELNSEENRFDWLLESFVQSTEGVRAAVAVSADGLLLARSAGISTDDADQLSAAVSGMVSLSRGASVRFGGNELKLIMVEMRDCLMIISSITEGSCLCVLAAESCDVGLIGYKITLLAERAATMVVPGNAGGHTSRL